MLKSIVACALASALHAQVFIVDAAGGAGSHFTDLAVAVNAVPSGSTLRVRPGTYGLATIQAKSLAIVGEGGQVCMSLRVTGLTAQQRVLVRNVVLQDIAPPRLDLTNNAGSIFVEYATYQSFGLFDGYVRACQAVHFHACYMTDGFGYRTLDIASSYVTLSRCTNPLQPYAGGIAATTSRVELFDSQMVGSKAANGYCYHGWPTPPRSDGQPGAALVDTQLLATRTTFVGGNGGQGVNCQMGPGCGSAGGFGITAQGASRITLLGSTTRGGVGGSCFAGTAPGVSLTASTQLLRNDRVVAPSANVSGAQVRGGTVQLDLRGEPGSIAVAALSHSAATVPLEPLGFGSILTRIDLVSPALTVPTSRATSLALPLPSSLPLGELWVGQFLALQTDGLAASNLFTLLLTQ